MDIYGNRDESDFETDFTPLGILLLEDDKKEEIGQIDDKVQTFINSLNLDDSVSFTTKQYIIVKIADSLGIARCELNVDDLRKGYQIEQNNRK